VRRAAAAIGESAGGRCRDRVVVGSGCAATLAGIEFAQAFAQPSTDPRQRLVPGKETWVRVLLLASQSGVASPTVRLTGYRGVAILGTLDMAGPSAVPAGSGTTVPDAVRYDERQSYNVELPAAWVASGLSVRIEVDPEQRLGPAIIADATPRIGNPTRLNIVLVPVVSGGFTPTLPSATAVVNELERRFPLARSSITVTTRAPYTLSSVTDGLDTQTEWSSALSELRQLRDLENPGNSSYRYYYGFVRRSGGSVAGIGYVPGRTALGWDSASGWSRTMSHELGHNFSRPACAVRQRGQSGCELPVCRRPARPDRAGRRDPARARRDLADQSERHHGLLQRHLVLRLQLCGDAVAP
jgi:trimeric autotransporter adhesin